MVRLLESPGVSKSFSITRVLLTTVIAVGTVVGAAWYGGYLQPLGFYRPANAIMMIVPYRASNTWVFDDAKVGLQGEPFISGIPEMIDDLVKDIPNADKGFRLYFSTQDFPGSKVKLTWTRKDLNGNWYFCEQYKKEGWLCPALFRYYKEAPREIFAKAEKK